MLIIAIDDEAPALESLTEAIHLAAPDAELHFFRTAQAGLDFAAERAVDVAFLDIHLPGIDGISLARRLSAIHPRTNIIFVTGHSSYAESAFSLHASGYVTKPVDAAAIRGELDHLRFPVAVRRSSDVYIQCFGNFAVFVDGQLLPFSCAKPQELLAYLVHKNGAGVTTAEIAALLWEDKAYDRSLRSQAQTVISQLHAILRDAGIDDILVRGWNSLAVDKARFRSDYYDLLAGHAQAMRAYTGEYLVNYSWAESVGAFLTKIVEDSQK